MIGLMEMRAQMRAAESTEVADLTTLGVTGVLIQGAPKREEEELERAMGMALREGMIKEAPVPEVLEMPEAEKMELVGAGLPAEKELPEEQLGLELGRGQAVEMAQEAEEMQTPSMQGMETLL